MNERMSVYGNLECLHRDEVSICGVEMKFYYPEFDGQTSSIQVVTFERKRMSPGRLRYIRRHIRGYLRRMAQRGALV